MLWIIKKRYYEKYPEPKVHYSSWFTVVIVVIVLVMTYNSIPYSSKSIKLPMVVTKLNNRLSTTS